MWSWWVLGSVLRGEKRKGNTGQKAVVSVISNSVKNT
jgi:hypothetical protein